MSLLLKRLFRYPIKFYSKMKTQKAYRRKVIATTTIVGSCYYYYRTMHQRKFKGLQKLSSIYRPHESDKEMVVFKNSMVEVLFDDKSLPMAILYPQRMMSLQKMVQMCHKYDIGIVNKNKTGVYLENDKYIEKQFVVINQKKMKSFEFDHSEKTITIGPGWKIHSLNEELAKYGFYIPLNHRFLHKRVFELFNEDVATLDYKHFKENFTDFKHLIKHMIVVLPDGTALPTKRNKLGNGLDFSGLFVGSKSTLGILGELTLKVVPIENKIAKEKFYFDKSFSDEHLHELLHNQFQIQHDHSELSGNVLSQADQMMIKQTKNYTKLEFILNNYQEEILQFSKARDQTSPLAGGNLASQQQQQQQLKEYSEEIQNSLKRSEQQSNQSKFSQRFMAQFKSARNEGIISYLESKCIRYIHNQTDKTQIISKFTGLEKYKQHVKRQNEKRPDIENSIYLRLQKNSALQVVEDIKQQINEFQQNSKTEFSLKYYPQTADLIIDIMEHPQEKEIPPQEANLVQINKNIQWPPQNTRFIQGENFKKQQEKKEIFYKTVVNIVINSDGEFIRCTDAKVNDYITQMSSLQQYGLNNIEQQIKLKQHFDPTKIYLSSSLWHSIMKPQFNIFHSLFNFS